MKLYTKHGDDGSTGLVGGERVVKCDVRVEAYGHVDETNAAIGAAIASCKDAEIAEGLRRIQSDLFVLGSELATPEGNVPRTRISPADIAALEAWIDLACEEVPPMRNFVLPGGCALAAALHLARTVCRRAERATVLLSKSQTVARDAVIYLNRLSDLFFALARQANHRAGVADTPWIAPKT